MTGWGNATPADERRLIVAEKNRAVAEAEALKAQVKLLRTELQEQWEVAHDEHCSNIPCQPGAECHWPRPAVLG